MRSARDGVGYSALASAESGPQIVVNNRYLHEIVDDAWKALKDSGAELFSHAGRIAEISIDAGGRPSLRHLGFPGLRGRLDRCAQWVRLTSEGAKPDRPPRDVLEDMVAITRVRVLKGITRTPTFSCDGELVTQKGYQSSTGLYYAQDDDAIPAVPGVPDSTDLKRARQIIGQEWLGDFPFADDASRAHAIAMPITVVAREMIVGPTPLFAIDAPAAGTGKSLLARCTGIIVDGSEPSMMTEARSEEELRKRLTAFLMVARPLVVFDNLRHRIDSGTFASLLTSPSWSDRILGRTEKVDLPNRTVWVATGNNLAFSDEIARRTVWIHLDARLDRPWDRTVFRQPDLISWLQRHRSEIVWAFLTLVQHWIASGRQAWCGKSLGSYEAWSSVVGGVLDASGIAGFLSNREGLYMRTDSETEEWRSFISAWWAAHSTEPVKAADLVVLAQEVLLSLFDRRDDRASERAVRTRLGTGLRERRDRRFGDFFIRKAGEDGHAKGAFWCLEAAHADESPADSNGRIIASSAHYPHGTSQVPRYEC